VSLYRFSSVDSTTCESNEARRINSQDYFFSFSPLASSFILKLHPASLQQERRRSSDGKNLVSHRVSKRKRLSSGSSFSPPRRKSSEQGTRDNFRIFDFSRCFLSVHKVNAELLNLRLYNSDNQMSQNREELGEMDKSERFETAN